MISDHLKKKKKNFEKNLSIIDESKGDKNFEGKIIGRIRKL